MGAWYCESVEAVRELDGKPTHALLWASQEGLDTLARRGHLALMDATHKTNWLDWLLYTIMVRDEAGSWLPVSHFVTKTGDGDIVGVALRRAKDRARRYTAQGREWNCRYFLTDDSAVEQKAIGIAFPGFKMARWRSAAYFAESIQSAHSGVTWLAQLARPVCSICCTPCATGRRVLDARSRHRRRSRPLRQIRSNTSSSIGCPGWRCGQILLGSTQLCCCRSVTTYY